MAQHKRGIPEINAGSMADIAFLLLIFFLVATTLDSEKGMLVKLPQWVEENLPPPDVNKRNVLDVLVNQYDQIQIKGELVTVKQVKAKTRRFLENNGANPDLSDSPQKAVVSIKSDRATSYGGYLEVYNEIREAYNELREEAAQSKFRKSLKDLNQDELTEIREMYPLQISEAEPESFGVER
jgi:biopolymer transport protein ExbD